MKYWLLKTEPDTWSWQQQLDKNIEKWDGVRNFQARNNILATSEGDLCLFYHTGKEKQAVGIVTVCSKPYEDTEDNRFYLMDVKTYKSLNKPVTLSSMKNNPLLENMKFLKHSRLSVAELEEEHFLEILRMSETEI